MDREKDLKDKYEKMMEEDAKIKAEKETKRLEHEEDMFIVDL